MRKNFKFKYEIEAQYKKYVRAVLHLTYRDCTFRFEDECCFCYTDTPEDIFHKVYARSKCFAKSANTKFFFITEEEDKDSAFKTYLVELFGVNGFIVED